MSLRLRIRLIERLFLLERGFYTPKKIKLVILQVVWYYLNIKKLEEKMSNSNNNSVIPIKNDNLFKTLNEANEQFSKYRELLEIINPMEASENYDYCNWDNTLTLIPNK